MPRNFACETAAEWKAGSSAALKVTKIVVFTHEWLKSLCSTSQELKNRGQIQACSSWGHLLLFLGLNLTYTVSEPWCQRYFGPANLFYCDAQSFQCCVLVSIGFHRLISFPSASGVHTNTCFATVETKAF